MSVRYAKRRLSEEVRDAQEHNQMKINVDRSTSLTVFPDFKHSPCQ